MKKGVPISQTQADRVAELAQTSLTVREIGEQAKVSARTVGRVLKERGIQRSTRQRRTRAKEDPAGQAGLGVTESLFSEFQELAEIIEKQLNVPTPGTPLRHSDPGASHTMELVEAGFEGDTGPVMEIFRAAMTPGWWRSDGVPQVLIRLNPQRRAVFERFMSIGSSKQFEGALEDWVRASEAYLRIERSSASDGDRRRASSEAHGAGENASRLLWGAVEAVRPPRDTEALKNSLRGS